MVATGTVLEQTLSGQLGPVRQRFRYELHDIQNNLLFDITLGFSQETTATVNMNNDREIVWSIDVNGMDASYLPSTYNRNSMFLAPFMDVWVAGAWQAFQLGLYRLGSPRRTFDDRNHEIWDVSGNDLGDLLQRAELSDIYSVPAAGSYVVYARVQLNVVGLQHSITDLGVLADTLQVWPLKNARMMVVNDLMFGANMYPIYSSAAGIFTSKTKLGAFTTGLIPISIPGGETAAAADVTYSARLEPKMVEAPAPMEESDNLYDNYVALTYMDPTNPNGSTIWYCTNNDPASLISSVTIGQQVVWDVNCDRIVNVKMQAVGVAHLLEQDAMVQQLTLTTFPDPRRAPHEFYTLDVPNIPSATLWRVMEWTLPLTVGGAMTHKLGRVIPRTFLLTAIA